MKIKTNEGIRLTTAAMRVLTVGLTVCLALSLMGLIGLLLPDTYQRYEAANSLLSFALRGLVLTLLITVSTDLLGRRHWE